MPVFSRPCLEYAFGTILSSLFVLQLFCLLDRLRDEISSVIRIRVSKIATVANDLAT